MRTQRRSTASDRFDVCEPPGAGIPRRQLTVEGAMMVAGIISTTLLFVIIAIALVIGIVVWVFKRLF
jgi:hypothetical protein